MFFSYNHHFDISQDPPSYYDDYDPNDVPEDQAAPAPDTGYSYPVPDNPLVLRRQGKTLSSSSTRMLSYNEQIICWKDFEFL